jgi:hypothetical protein
MPLGTYFWAPNRKHTIKVIFSNDFLIFVLILKVDYKI